ncbi:MAG: PKD domain-containing protein, partial [Chloroflexi bacterium]
FNGDGKADLAVVDQATNSVSIFLAGGTGMFVHGSNVATGVKPSAIAAGDLNGDGRQDLVVSNQTSNSVTVLLGNGSGGFAPRPSVPTNGGPAATVLADFNRDGKLDIASANMLANNVSVLIGDGSGAFVPWALSPFATGNMPEALAAVDLNGDGALDIVTANVASNNVSALLSQAATATTVHSSSNPSTAGESLTFTVTVTHPSGSLVPGGTVAFEDGTATIGSSPLGSTGTAAFATSTLAPGNHFIVAAYSGDSNYDPSQSLTLTQVIIGVPTTGALIGTPNPADVTQPVTLTAAPSGGIGPYSYAWSLLSVPSGSTALLSSATAGSPTFTADLAGPYSVQLVVKDSHGISSSPGTLTVTVNADPGTPSVKLSPSPADVTQTITASAAITGGTGPYTYAWLLTPPTGSAATLSNKAAANPSFTPDIPGAYTVQLVIIDRNGFASPAGTATMAVDPLPSVGFITSTPSPADTGQTVHLSSNTSGGTGAFSHAWTLTAPAGSKSVLSSSSADSPTFVPDIAGTYTAALTVTDANGKSASATPLSISVSAAPSISSISASPASPDAGQRVHFAATVSGGGGPDTFAWTIISPSGIVTNLAGATPSLVVSETGAYNVSLVVTDG